ncbi:type II toxin-antitoxin system HicB family antitoxin [Peribacillus saganii]|uniref:type II toxin-antitoxin system HicB family antitoxin n=1 Tax=Peribacillus saganii TaxID=2303992 RepID=UPI001314AFBF|nr:DUF3986 family protein [Peribacillus saganii]
MISDQDLYIYPAIIEKDEDGFYIVTFPDFAADESDGLEISYAGSKKETIEHAKEVLAIHIGYMLDDKKEIPQPSQKELPLTNNQKLIKVQISLNEYRNIIDVHLAGRHFHPGYYENGECIEGIAFKNKDGTWTVYYEDFLDAGLFDFSAERDEDFGVVIFTAESEEKVSEMFIDWAESVLLPFRKKKP